ncbi:O-antigen ligase family protein [Enterovibrio coralii]|uniref:O-antigen ligase-related domain-containing protein n=1 Tax=Enterovibrio coralii TaxID=294935 RepID=A0A135IB87_9GAMM|nr:O-antigen ligase family protein [Enterovibrio coralii]KXF82733.1 hypothetical protein ATN88_14780 [Enterovibrio coralii]
MANAVVSQNVGVFFGKKSIYNMVLFFFFVFVVSLVTSKPGMNISAAVLAIASLSMFILNYSKIANSKYLNATFCISFGVYFLFAVVSFFHPSIVDFEEFLYKSLYLLVIPIATLLLMDDDTRRKATLLLVVASLIASIYSIYNFVTIADFNIMIRTSGFLSSDRHLNCVILSSCICLHYLLSNKLETKVKVLILFTLVLFLTSLVVSSTRGGWLAAAVSLSFLIVRYHRRLIPYIAVALVACTLLFSAIGGNMYKELANRFTSIGNVTSDVSNTSRINMWKGGLSYLTHLSETQPETVVFGGGMDSSATNYFKYLDSLTEEERDSYGKDGFRLGGTDFHMTFIDMSVKSGVLFTVTILGLFSIVACYAIFSCENNDVIKYMGAYLIGVFVWLPFYSIMQSYSAYIFTFAIAIVLAEYVKAKKIKSERDDEISLV